MAANISQILLVIGLYFAWKQLSVGIKDIQLRSRREAGMISIQEADKFANEIIPAFDEINRKFGGLQRAPNKLDQFLPSEIHAVNQQKYKDRLSQMSGDLENNICALANKIESIATAFMKGIADEEVVFEAVAPVYCEMIEDIYFFYCHYRRRENEINLYQNTINLYGIWSARIEKTGLEINRKTLEKKLISATHRSSPVIPLGTSF